MQSTVSWLRENIWIVIPIVVAGFAIIILVVWAIVKCAGGIKRSRRVASRVKMLDMELKTVPQRAANDHATRNPTFAGILPRVEEMGAV